MSNIDRVKEKLAKLLRLGEDTAASEGEIQNALNLATQMMAKHQLTREDIDMSAADPIAKVQLGRHFAFCKGSTLTTWESNLTSFVKNFIGSVSCYNAGKMPIRRNGIATDFFGGAGDSAREAIAIAYYGSDDDARCAVSMFEELRDAIATMALIRWGGWMRGDGGAYAYGFVCGLLEAHRSAVKNLMNQDATTSALILKSETTALAIVEKGKDWLATTHGVQLRKKAGRRTVSYSSPNARTAMNEGKRDGSNYNPTRPGSRTRIA
jgi:hypothetical protein